MRLLVFLAFILLFSSAFALTPYTRDGRDLNRTEYNPNELFPNTPQTFDRDASEAFISTINNIFGTNKNINFFGDGNISIITNPKNSSITLGISPNFNIADFNTTDLNALLDTQYVPYIGALYDVNLGAKTLTVDKIDMTGNRIDFSYNEAGDKDVFFYFRDDEGNMDAYIYIDPEAEVIDFLKNIVTTGSITMGPTNYTSSGIQNTTGNFAITAPFGGAFVTIYDTVFSSGSVDFQSNNLIGIGNITGTDVDLSLGTGIIDTSGLATVGTLLINGVYAETILEGTTSGWRLLADVGGVEYLQVGANAADTGARIQFTRRGTAETNMEQFRVYADYTYLYGLLRATGQIKGNNIAAEVGDVVIETAGKGYALKSNTGITRYGLLYVGGDVLALQNREAGGGITIYTGNGAAGAGAQRARITIPANADAVTIGLGANSLSTTANMLINSNTGGLYLGAGQDGWISHSGTVLTIQSDFATAQDTLKLRGGTTGIDFYIGTQEEMSLTSNLLTLRAGTSLMNASDDKINFRDTAIGIYSEEDGFLDVFADKGIRIGNSTTGVTIDSNVAIRENLKVDGNILGNQIYGEMYFLNEVTPTTITIADANTYYQITSLLAGKLNGFTVTDSNLTAKVAGTYKLDYHVSFSGGSGNVFELTAGINHEEQTNCEGLRKIGTGGDVGNMGGTCFITVNVGDDVTILIEDETTPTTNARIYSTNINLVRIGT